MLSYYLLMSPQDKLLTVFKVDASPEKVQAYWILNKQWQETDYLWELLSDEDSRLVEIGNAEVQPILAVELDASMTKMSLVSKSAAERRFTLGPMYVPDVVDAHGEWTDANELQKAVWDYVRKGDRRIRLQHNRDVVAGEWVEIMTFPYTMSVPMNKADGSQTDLSFPKDTVFLGVIWEPWAWDLVKSGELRGYSIGGKAERLYVDLEEVSKEDPTANGVHVDTVMGNSPSAKLPKRKKQADVPTEK